MFKMIYFILYVLILRIKLIFLCFFRFMKVLILCHSSHLFLSPSICTVKSTVKDGADFCVAFISCYLYSVFTMSVILIIKYSTSIAYKSIFVACITTIFSFTLTSSLLHFTYSLLAKRKTAPLKAELSIPGNRGYFISLPLRLSWLFSRPCCRASRTYTLQTRRGAMR